jgi:D-glycero-D-manno-heptose 1,7-bisphosphate phosphatase
MSRLAVFMDRDGVVNDEVGYVTSIDAFRLLPRVDEAIRRINDAGLLAIVVTNQSGVARGFFDEDLVESVHALLRERLAAGGARLDGIYVCPHHPDQGVPPWRRRCDCRKPEPGLMLQAAAEHGIDLAASYMVGDSARDLEAARRAGMAGILVLTGYGRSNLQEQLETAGARPAFVAEDLLDAVEWILRTEQRKEARS